MNLNTKPRQCSNFGDCGRMLERRLYKDRRDEGVNAFRRRRSCDGACALESAKRRFGKEIQESRP